MKKVVLLKKIGRNEEGYVAYPSDRTGFFVFKGFEVSLEAVEDDPTLFNVIDYENYQQH